MNSKRWKMHGSVDVMGTIVMILPVQLWLQVLKLLQLAVLQLLLQHPTVISENNVCFNVNIWLLVSDNQSKCQVCGQDGEIGKCNTAQDNGDVEFCDEEYVCYFVYESKVPNCIKDVLFCKFSFQSFMVWIVSLSTLGTVGLIWTWIQTNVTLKIQMR